MDSETHASRSAESLMDPSQLFDVLGTLNELIENVGPESIVGIILQQAYMELASIVATSPAVVRESPRHPLHRSAN